MEETACARNFTFIIVSFEAKTQIKVLVLTCHEQDSGHRVKATGVVCTGDQKKNKRLPNEK